MFALKEQLEPITRQYNRYINGEYLSDLLKVKGGQSVGTDYISKVFRSRHHEIFKNYDLSVKSVKDPEFYFFLKDNLFRIFGLNCVERLVTAVQAYPMLRANFFNPGTVSHTFTEITNQGILKGFLRGSLLTLLQTGTVLYPSVYVANKSNKKYLSFLTTYTILDALMYPIDTLKTILHAETIYGTGLSKALKCCHFPDLYQGIFHKLLFNVPVLTSMYLTTQGGQQVAALFSWAVTAALYPVLTMKVGLQLIPTPYSAYDKLKYSEKRSLYRGIIPFLALNLGFSWTLRPLFNENKLNELLQEGEQNWQKSIGEQRH